MHELAEKTRNLNPPPIRGLPFAILINGIYHSTPILEAKLYRNLKRVICDLYTGEKPKECQDLPVLLEFYYESNCPTCQSFMTEHLFPTWKTLSKSSEQNNISLPINENFPFTGLHYTSQIACGNIVAVCQRQITK